MGSLLSLSLIALFFWFVFRKSNIDPSIDDLRYSADSKTSKRDRTWLKFLKSEHDRTQNKVERTTLERLFIRLEEMGVHIPDDLKPDLSKSLQQEVKAQSKTVTLPAELQTETSEQTVATQENNTVQKATHPRQAQLDNASVLLYFGAFLFIASSGLFVAFSGVDGSIRTFVVLIVSLCMYFIGVSLFKNKKKYAEAGLAFAGIGITTAPLVGLAAYTYVFDSSNGPLVWFATSVYCISLYFHALVVLRKPLLNYVFIFTLVSLFQSFVSVIDAPIYFFGWVFSILGIVTVLISRKFELAEDFTESARQSSQLFIPLSLLLSLLLLENSGATQLGVTFALAAMFYGLQAVITEKINERYNYITSSHVLTLLSIGTITYGVSESVSAVSTMLSICAAIHFLMIALWPKFTTTIRDIASIALICQVIGLLFGVGSPGLLLSGVLVMSILSLLVWLRQNRSEIYIVFIIATTSIPLIWGQLLLEPTLNSTNQIALLFIPLFVQLAALMFSSNLEKKQKDFQSTSLQLYALSTALIGLSTFTTSADAMIIFCSALVLLAVVVSETQRNSLLAELSGLLLFLPLLRTYDAQPSEFLFSVMFGLVVTIALTVRYRSEVHRWSATVFWLLMPIALAQVNFGGNWSFAGYAWAYILVTLALVLSRAIARGILLRSSKVKLKSLERTASVSYVAGYVLALLIVAIIGATGDISSGMAVALFGSIFIIVALVGISIEKDRTILALLPVISQLILWAFFSRPFTTNDTVSYILATTLLSLVWCIAAFATQDIKSVSRKALLTGGLLTAAIAPATFLYFEKTYWPMPIGLGVLSVLLYISYGKKSQEYREWFLGLLLGSVWWLWIYMGVTEIQVYAHSLVALFAGYAYWRSLRKDKLQSQNYIVASLSSATIPLALQALNPDSGSFYGWWLLLEQIVIMLIGMGLQNRLMIRWGLYVALGSVLYQLRDLGWAALAVLAIFVIGMAVYKIQKYGDKD